MDRGYRPTHPVRRLKYWLCRLVRVWVWECAVDTGFSVIGRLYCLRSSPLRLRMFWVVSFSDIPLAPALSRVPVSSCSSWSLFVRSTLRFLYPLLPH